MFKRIPGTRDILPEQVENWQRLESISRSIFSTYNFQEIRPPLIEEASLFNRSLGEATEIVQKQMFIIKSASDAYALRPEATASIVRAYIENNLDKVSKFVKVYYMGPMFRMERPQKGRLRQFHHIGCEAIGSQEAAIDVEVISLADTLLKEFSITGYTIKINSLGCSKDKAALTETLRNGLKSKLQDLCDDCKVRFDRNVLRVLDCKNERCQEIVKGLNIKDYLCPECSGHFLKVRQGLDALEVKYEVSEFLVRGLDYYTRTVFEIIHPDLGPQQNALGAGGRYDNLVKELDGPEAGAVGFAFGVERLLLVLGDKPAEARKNLAFIITLGDEAKLFGLKLLADLRGSGMPSDTDYENKSLKGAMRKADDAKARFVIIIGDNELKNNSVMLKDMASGEQKEVKADNLIEELKKT
ncbi:MAG: histidine--tRNA ligase [Candidatus Omnitrophica bacterium]|nr:histidine--tRNA ligase [Candidatus Omnitrophota bacterium]